MTRDQIRTELIDLLKEARDDWDDSVTITDDTGLFLDLGFESIDAVGLGSALEGRFGQTLPFAEFMSQAKEDDLSDITIGSLVDFLVANVKGSGEAKSA